MSALGDFGDQEKLLRLVPSKPDFWKEQENRPSSALFKDSKGVSVNRGGPQNACEQESYATLRRHNQDKDIRCTVFIVCQDCWEAGALLMPDPKPGNIYHAKILKSHTEISLTNSMARKLALRCVLFEN